MTENYDVKYILSKGGCTQIRYTVCPADAEPEENIVSRADKTKIFASCGRCSPA